MRAILYCRVSSQRQVDEGNGLDSQEQRCRSYANSKGYSIASIFRDEGISGGLFERPAMQQLLQYLDSHPSEKFVVIFDDLSRLARDLGVHLKLKTELVKLRGVTLECPNFNFEDSPEGEFIENVIASKVQLDREQNRRQVIQKQKARLEMGYWPFCLPRALINIKNPPPIGKVTSPNEPHASVYREAILEYHSRELLTIEDVRNYINSAYREQNLKFTISLTGATDMLKEPLYAGLVEYKPWGVSMRQAQFTGLVSSDIFYQVQLIIAGKSKGWNRRDYSDSYPLRRLVRCSVCGTPLTGSATKGRNGHHPHYFCRNKNCERKWSTVRPDVIEPRFVEYLSRNKPTDELLDLAEAVFIERWEAKLKTSQGERITLQNSIKSMTESKESFLKRIRKGCSDSMAEVYEQEIEKANKQLLSAEAKLKNFKPMDTKQFGTATDKVMNTLKNPQETWTAGGQTEKQSVVLMYFGNSLTYDLENGFGTANSSYPINQIVTLANESHAGVEMPGNDPGSASALKHHLQA